MFLPYLSPLLESSQRPRVKEYKQGVNVSQKGMSKNHKNDSFCALLKGVFDKGQVGSGTMKSKEGGRRNLHLGLSKKKMKSFKHCWLFCLQLFDFNSMF